MIEKLRLTDGEKHAILEQIGEPERIVSGAEHALLDAQLRKALKGVETWLEGFRLISDPFGPLYATGWMGLLEALQKDLGEALEAAGKEHDADEA